MSWALLNLKGWFLAGWANSQSCLWASLIAQLVKSPPAMQEIPSSIPGSGRSPGEGIGYPLQYSQASFVAQLLKESACSSGDLGSIPELGRSPGDENGYPLQYFGLENSSPWGHKESDMTEWLSLQSCLWGFPSGSVVKNFNPWVVKIPWKREWQPTPVLLRGELHGQRSLLGKSPWSHGLEYNWVTNTFTSCLWAELFISIQNLQSNLSFIRLLLWTIYLLYLPQSQAPRNQSQVQQPTACWN